MGVLPKGYKHLSSGLIKCIGCGTTFENENEVMAHEREKKGGLLSSRNIFK